MGRMIRKQIYIKPEQDDALKRRAHELGISEAALIRLGIDRLTKGYTEPTDRSAWERELAFIRKQAWEQSKAFIKKRMEMDVPQTGRGWTRDELYEDRLERFSR